MPDRDEPVDRFRGLTVTQETEYERHRQRLYIGYGLALLTGLCFLAVVVTICVLAIQKNLNETPVLLSSLGPYLLPIVGGLVAFAYGSSKTR